MVTTQAQPLSCDFHAFFPHLGPLNYNFLAMTIAETPRLILREFRIEDAPAMDALFRDPAVMQFSIGSPLLSTPDWIARCRVNYHAQGYGRWAVVKKTKEAVIGFCGLALEPEVNGRPEVELGYRLASSEWGSGYATEAATAVRDYAFGPLGLQRLIALIDPANVASIRVAENIGMCREADVLLDGYDHPDHVYVVEHAGGSLVSEYRPRN